MRGRKVRQIIWLEGQGLQMASLAWAPSSPVQLPLHAAEAEACNNGMQIESTRVS